VSFTHLIAFAMVRALTPCRPCATSSLEVEGKPAVVRPEHFGLGLGGRRGERRRVPPLLVPVIQDADTLDFRGVPRAYEEVIRKIRTKKLDPRCSRRRR
jgi:multifunctional 2-oxoglutarate metabolism enzyme